MAKLTLLAAIAAAFVSNPREEKLIYTSDGQCFRVKDKSHAERHAKVNKLTVKEAVREDYTEAIKEIESKLNGAKAAEPAASETEGKKGKGGKKANKSETEGAEASETGDAGSEGNDKGE